MREYKRSDRVRELMRRELSDIIQRQVKDPRVGFCTVTRVLLSDDLQHAKVYISSIESSDRIEQTLQGLEKATPFIRREIGRRLRMRHIPEIRFLFDPSIEYMDHIDRLLRKISTEDATEEE